MGGVKGFRDGWMREQEVFGGERGRVVYGVWLKDEGWGRCFLGAWPRDEMGEKDLVGCGTVVATGMLRGSGGCGQGMEGREGKTWGVA